MPFRMTVFWAGALQGLVFWWLSRAHTFGHWPATEPITFSAILYAAFAVPLVIYCTQGIDRLPTWMRRVALATYLVLYAALGAYATWASGATGRETGVGPANALAAMVLGFVSLSLLCGFDWSMPKSPSRTGAICSSTENAFGCDSTEIFR